MPSSQTCADKSAGGTIEITNLGPTDAQHARNAQGTIVSAISGSFKICYKLLGGRYEQVGTSLVNVNPSHRELVQKVSGYNDLASCSSQVPFTYSDGVLCFMSHSLLFDRP